jgi:hydrogenase/urease accessory protein HupE
LTAEIVKALIDLIPVMEALGRVGILILASIVGLGIVIYIAYKLPTVLKDINTAIVNSTTVAQESVETLK